VRGIGGFLFDNLGLKLVSLLLALVVYLHVYTERPAMMAVSFPVQVTGLPESLAVVRSDPAEVTAELRGTGKQLIRLRLTEPSVRLSLAGAHVGIHRRHVRAEDLPVREPEPLEVARMIEPAEVEFEVERVVAKSVRVFAQFTGLPPGGAAPEWKSLPASVLVRGPRSVLAGIDSLALEPVRVRAGRDTTRIMTRVAAMPRACTADPEAVVLRIAPVRTP
jgi:YbbR domain-containing protein